MRDLARLALGIDLHNRLRERVAQFRYARPITAVRRVLGIAVPGVISLHQIVDIRLIIGGRGLERRAPVNAERYTIIHIRELQVVWPTGLTEEQDGLCRAHLPALGFVVKN